MAKSGFASGFAGFLIGVVTGLGVAARRHARDCEKSRPFR